VDDFDVKKHARSEMALKELTLRKNGIFIYLYP